MNDRDRTSGVLCAVLANRTQAGDTNWSEAARTVQLRGLLHVDQLNTGGWFFAALQEGISAEGDDHSDVSRSPGDRWP